MTRELTLACLLCGLAVPGALVGQVNNSIFMGGSEDGHDVHTFVMASNNGIFGGGAEDGHDVYRFTINSNNDIFAGGIEDGHDVHRFMMNSNNDIFGGGIEDGHDIRRFITPSNNGIFAGGIEDGHEVHRFIMSSNNGIFGGGEDDGHTILCFRQTTNNGIFGGGIEDGHSIHCYLQPANNSIFGGGDFDGHNDGCTPMDPAPVEIGIVYVDSTATGFNDGSSWEHAFTEMQSALLLATENSKVDTILVAKGTYLPTSGSNRSTFFNVPDSLHILCGFPNGGGMLDSRDPSQYPVVWSGDIGVPSMAGDNVYHVIVVLPDSRGTIVDGVYVRHGFANSFGFNSIGSALINFGQITFVNAEFSENAGLGNGAVIYSVSSDSELILKEVTVIASPMSNPVSVAIVDGAIDMSDDVRLEQD